VLCQCWFRWRLLCRGCQRYLVLLLSWSPARFECRRRNSGDFREGAVCLATGSACLYPGYRYPQSDPGIGYPGLLGPGQPKPTRVRLFQPSGPVRSGFRVNLTRIASPGSLSAGLVIGSGRFISFQSRFISVQAGSPRFRTG
jgi:hypothetical protein